MEIKILSKKSKIMICAAFWIFGVCNNYSYVVMLSAASDILKKLENINSSSTKNSSHGCTKIGTGAILIADVVPTLIFKFFAPLFIQSIKFSHKIIFVVITATASLIIVGMSQSISLTLFGVVLASLSSGVGEVTFLALTAFFEKDSILFWSSGTGGAGVFGALSYAGLTQVLSPENTLFSVSVLPLFIIIAYFFLLKKPQHESFQWSYSSKYEILLNDGGVVGNDKNENEVYNYQKTPSNMEKVLLIKKFLFLTVPLGLVYLFEYFINQALFEMLYYPNTPFLSSPQEQYRWYQVTYQIGVFISRSSIKFIKIRKTWIFTILQSFNVVLFLFQIAYRFIPSIWINLILILYEGLLGGGAYVNTFFFILTKSTPEYKEFNMGAASFWDSFGISIAGIISIPIHNLLCDKFPF